MGVFKCVSVMYGGLDDAWLEKAEVEECTPNGSKKAARVLLTEDRESYIMKTGICRTSY